METKPRFSELSYTGYKKITRQPRRSVVVSFNIDDVYKNAELIRRQKGGAAIVLGALSPRTRNAQVAMYQAGEVDYMVATDAIGMGLNMDVSHVSLAATRKYDGRQVRELNAAEMAQIAGRAGRYMKNGTFGVTGPVSSLDPDTVERIEEHKFEPLQKIFWRNRDLDFTSIKMLIGTLERSSESPVLVKGRDGDDHTALRHLLSNDEVMALATTPDTIRLLWEVCQIPDFAQTTQEQHNTLLSEIYTRLLSGPVGAGIEKLSEDWIAGNVTRLDQTSTDIDTLMSRIAHIRTWTYITHKREWVKAADEWQAKTRDIEDMLSDSLHQALTTRFVDKRSSILLRSLKEGEELLAGVKKDGNVIVEGHPVGHLQAFQFIPDESAIGTDRKAIMSAARAALKTEINRRVMSLLKAENSQFSLDDDGQIYYQPLLNNPMKGDVVAKITKGNDLLEPNVTLTESGMIADEDKPKIVEKLSEWLKAHITETLAPLMKLKSESNEEPAAVRGINYQLSESLGVVHRSDVEELISTLDEDGRKALRAKRVKLGPILVFLPELNKPKTVRLRAMLWTLWNDEKLPATVPNDGSVSVVVDSENIDRNYYRAISYPVFGPRAIRIDMLDRVINAIYENAKDGKFQAQHKMAEWLGCSIDDLYAILSSMGHKHIKPKAEENSVEKSEAEEDKTQTSEAEKTSDDKAAAIAEDNAKKTNDSKKAGDVTDQEQAKPELDYFWLKKGQIHKKAKPKSFSNKKPPKGKKGKKPFDKGPRVIKAEAKKNEEDNPFAILGQLKGKK
ncbi:MAG: helicase [Micavibrio sp.]|nr:helicase [Micavibrio sp.]